MKIFVKTLKGTTHFEVEVKPDDSVADVKKNIETVQGANVYPAGKLMLTHQGEVLKDETTIEENKVAENAFIVIMMTKSKPASTGAGASSASDAPAVQAKSMPTSSTQPSTSPQPPASVAIPAAPAPAAATETVAAPVPESVSATPPASTPALESTPTGSHGDIGLPATMAPPLLKLGFVKGPRDGECFEYKAGSVIGIGRLVSGNKITVKEAGISSKHLRIVSDSENWIIEDLGSSNGTIVNLEVLDPRIPVNLHHGDIIKIGELTSIIVKFETNVTAEEPKLPPRPGRNNRRLPVADPDPVQEKPTAKGRSAKQDEDEPAKRRKATRIKAKVGRPRKKVAIRKEEEEVPVEKKGNSRAQGGKKNTEAVQNSGFEDTPSKGVEISAMIRSRQIGKRLEENVKSEDTAFEEMRGPSRATRSKKKEIGGDSFKELDMVLSQARANNKKMKQKQSDSAVEEIDITLDESDCKAGVETSDGVKKAEQESWNENNLHKADLEKMTLGEWFKYMEVYLRKQIVDETEKMIEEMRSRSRRVHQYIAEQKQAKGKGKESTS